MEDGKYRDAKYEERFDLAIDHAVREMLDVEPPADLRVKVAARIEAQPASGFRLPAFSFQLPASSFQRFAAVAVAAALLVLVLMVARRPEPPAPSVVARVDGHLPMEPATQPAMEEPAAPQPVASSAKRAAAQLRAVAYAATTETMQAAPGIDPLKPIAPIEVAPIGEMNIAQDPIVVRPLTPITEMQIAPLNPPDRRD
jgi:hypothetical protein